MTVYIESCVENLEESLAAQQAGALGLELCSQLQLDGLSPPESLILQVTNAVSIPVKVMVRNRHDTFVYTDDDMQIMKEYVMQVKALGKVSGFVFGACTLDGQLHIDQIREISVLAYPIPLTVHKAIDTCLNPVKEAERLNTVDNVKYILSSGGAPTALEGAEVLINMQQIFKGIIIAAGKITVDNLFHLKSILGLIAYHGKRIVS